MHIKERKTADVRCTAGEFDDPGKPEGFSGLGKGWRRVGGKFSSSPPSAVPAEELRVSR